MESEEHYNKAHVKSQQHRTITKSAIPDTATKLGNYSLFLIYFNCLIFLQPECPSWGIAPPFILNTRWTKITMYIPMYQLLRHPAKLIHTQLECLSAFSLDIATPSIPRCLCDSCTKTHTFWFEFLIEVEVPLIEYKISTTYSIRRMVASSGPDIFTHCHANFVWSEWGGVEQERLHLVQKHLVMVVDRRRAFCPIVL